MLERHPSVHVLRDPTRGGLASALNEIARSSHTGITIVEDQIHVNDGVRGACEIMGFDPLYVANEGKVLLILPEKEAQDVLEIMKSFPEGKQACVIGKVTGEDPGLVTLRTTIGSHRIVDMISGEQLPRIC